MADMTHYQKTAKVFACYKDPMYPVLGLAEEAGEVAGKFAKFMRGDKGDLDIYAVAKELGDVLWMVSQVCEELGLDMSDVAIDNIAKLTARKEAGTIKGDGDER